MGGLGGGGGPMDFGRSKSKFQEVPETGVSFADVAGADQAKLELQEVVDFLKNPGNYFSLTHMLVGHLVHVSELRVV